MRERISSCVPNEIKKKNFSKKGHVFKKRFKKKNPLTKNLTSNDDRFFVSLDAEYHHYDRKYD